MNEPTTFRAGDSAAWAESLSAYPAGAGWSLKYRLLWPAGQGVDIPSAADGDGHAISLTRAETANWTAGKATLVSWVEKGEERVTIGQVAVTVLPDLTQSINHDGRSQNRKALDDAEAALAAHIASGKMVVAEYEIAGRKMKFRDVDQILALIAHYKPLVARENSALLLLQGGSVPGRVYYRG